jgi:hypothetical protein
MFPSMQKLAQPNRHAEWTALKKKHAAAIKAKKIVFDEKLGAALDKLSEHEAKLKKAETAGTLTTKDWQAHLALYAPVDSLVTSYRAKIKGLGGPAESELGAALTHLADDHKAWQAAWTKLETARAALNKVQTAAAGLRKPMDNLLTRTPPTIKEITALVAKHKKMIADTNTVGGRATMEVQNYGKAALFELKHISERIAAARTAAAAIEKGSSQVAGEAAFERFKLTAAGLSNRDIGPLTEAVKGIMNPGLTIGASIQLNGIKAYGQDYLRANDEFMSALKGMA